MANRSSLQRFHIPEYSRNAVVQLIVFSGAGFILMRLIWITLIVYAVPEAKAVQLSFEYIALGSLHRIQERWWTIFSYAWCHSGFWEWLSSMLWLFLFGNVVQSLVGYKQIIPIYLYSTIAGGLAFALAQLLPNSQLSDQTLVMGAHAGIMAMMVAGLTLSFSYRIYLSDYFSVPLLVMGIIFTVLMLLAGDMRLARWAMLLAGSATGFVYVKLLQSGYQPGSWIYRFYHKFDAAMSPKEAYKPLRPKVPEDILIDQILDKINEKGYHSLTAKEKETLRNANR